MEDRIGMASARWLEAAKKIEAWLGDPRLSEDYLRFRMDLARAYADALTALAQAPGAGAPESEWLLKAGEVNFDPEILRHLFSTVMRSREKSGPRGEAMARIVERAGSDPGLLPRLARLSVFEAEGDEIKALAEGLSVSVIELLLLGRLLAVPFVVAAVSRRPAGGTGILPVSSDHGLEGHATTCPACGSAPLLSRLRREDGKRRLVCSLCATEWSFPRIMCPGCKSTAENGLTVISLAESEGRWIEVCEQCRHYIKTIDERKLPPGELDPFEEESITLPLDLLAEREGYLR